MEKKIKFVCFTFEREREEKSFFEKKNRQPNKDILIFDISKKNENYSFYVNQKLSNIYEKLYSYIYNVILRRGRSQKYRYIINI